MTYDAIIIGAGHNGLVTGIYLAKAGWKVLILERNAEPGGAVRTAEVTLPGFKHDLFASNLSLFAGSPFYAEFGNDLARHGLEFVSAPHTFSSVYPDASWLGVSTTPGETEALLRKHSSHDADTWRRMSADFPDNAAKIFPLLGERMPSMALLRLVLNNVRSGGIGWGLDTLRLLTSSSQSFLQRHFENPRTHSLLAAWGMHLDFAPETPGGALFPYLEGMANQALGMAFGKGGASNMTRALCGLFAQLGGELRCKAEVTAIDLHGNRAVGARVGNESVKASRAVIGNLAPPVFFKRLVPEVSLPALFRRGVNRYRFGTGTMMIHLAMDDLPEWKAGPALRDYAYVHIAPWMSDMSRTFRDVRSGLLPSSPLLVVAQPTTIDPSRAPAGKHVLSIQVRAVPARIEGDAKGTINARDWSDAKEPFADRIIDILDSYAPGVRGQILGRTVLTPVDLEASNPNLVGGCGLGGSMHLTQNFFMRPITGWSTYRTPIRDLYMVGASTWPGAGTGAGSGRLLGKMLTQA